MLKIVSVFSHLESVKEKKTIGSKMNGRQNRLAAKNATNMIKEQTTSVKTRRSQQVQVLSDVSGNVPAETRKSRRKSSLIVDDVQETASKRPAEEAQPTSPKKRDRKSAPTGESARKTSMTNSAIKNNACDKVQTTQPQKRGQKSAAIVADVHQMTNPKQSDERKTITPKKRGRKSGVAVKNEEQSVGVMADSKEQISPNQPKKRGPKSARASTTQNIRNKSLARATSSIDKEDQLQEIIMKKYFHISERLRINTSAKCLRDLINCSKTHTKDVSFRRKVFFSIKNSK